MSRGISLLYFLSWNCAWVLQKKPTKVQNFRLSTAQVKIKQMCTLTGYFLLKVCKFQLKNYRRVMSHDTEEWWKVWRKNIVSKMTRSWWKLILALKRLKNLHFDWSLLCEVQNVWPKNVQSRYISWHWRVMQSLKKNWLRIWKKKWGIFQSVKIGTFMPSFCPK